MNYTQAVQWPITFMVYTTAGAAYTTAGSPPTLLVAKNDGAPASAGGTLAHKGSGLWCYTPSVSEVAATCWQLHLTWSLSGVQTGDVNVQMENDYTAGRAASLGGLVPTDGVTVDESDFDTEFDPSTLYVGVPGQLLLTPVGVDDTDEALAVKIISDVPGPIYGQYIKIWESGTFARGIVRFPV